MEFGIFVTCVFRYVPVNGVVDRLCEILDNVGFNRQVWSPLVDWLLKPMPVNVAERRRTVGVDETIVYMMNKMRKVNIYLK